MMRDPYEVFGMKRGAQYKQIRKAYTKLALKRHPDHGGSSEAFIELNTAYERVLADIEAALKAAASAKPEEPKSAGAKASQEKARQRQQDAEADVEDELERMRREAKARAQSRQQQEDGRMKATAPDFVSHVIKLGLRNLFFVVAGVMAFGAFLVELDIVGIFIILGSIVAGIMSKGFRLGQHQFLLLAGTVILTCSLVLASMTHHTSIPITGMARSVVVTKPIAASITNSNVQPKMPVNADQEVGVAAPTPAPRTLLAAPDGVLKIDAGISYVIKLRSGHSTRLAASVGRVTQVRNGTPVGGCVTALDFATPSSGENWAVTTQEIQSCDGRDVVLHVSISN